jgi:putative serine protease PepD
MSQPPDDPWSTPHSPAAPAWWVQPPAAPAADDEPDPTVGFDTLGAPVDHRAPGSSRRRGRAGVVVGAVLLALVCGVVGGAVGAWWVQRPATLYDSGASLGTPPSGTLTRPADSVAGIAQRVLPVVVSIDVRGADGGGTGSGFVIRSDGYLLTNNHVVAQAATGGSITVHFNDGSTSTARIVGRSPAYDLAVLKVQRTGLPVATLGNSDAVVVGDECIAIGSPLGLAGTVTTGIISATHRPVTTGADDGSEPSYLSALQTDAAINPGNSGGPLVDAQGRVIGVNSAIATLGSSSLSGGQTGSIGLGFSIPVNQARRVAEQLIQRGYATHPVVGASLDPAYDGNGVRITQVQPGGGADRGGLKPGDVVVSVDGVPVTAPEQLIVAIRSKQPGDTVVLGVQRGGSGPTVTLPVTLGEARG